MDGSQEGRIMERVRFSTNAMLMLNASCQGLVEGYIEPVENPWYEVVFSQLHAARRHVREWRNSGTLYFDRTILESSARCGERFVAQADEIAGGFDSLIRRHDPVLRDHLVGLLKELRAQVRNIDGEMAEYYETLTVWGVKMQGAHQNMADTVRDIQSEQTRIRGEIEAINITIDAIREKVKNCNDRIARLRSQNEKYRKMYLLYLILAPFTAGATLVLIAMGTASIAEAEEEVRELSREIEKDGLAIAEQQRKLDADSRELAALGGLTLSTRSILNDLERVSGSVLDLRTLWSYYMGDMDDIIAKLTAAAESDSYLAGKVWFMSALNEWKYVVGSIAEIERAPEETVKIHVNG